MASKSNIYYWKPHFYVHCLFLSPSIFSHCVCFYIPDRFLTSWGRSLSFYELWMSVVFCYKKAHCMTTYFPFQWNPLFYNKLQCFKNTLFSHVFYFFSFPRKTMATFQSLKFSPISLPPNKYLCVFLTHAKIKMKSLIHSFCKIIIYGIPVVAQLK